MPEFQALSPTPALTPGLVLRIGTESFRYLRLTHVFKTNVYGMWVGDPEAARYARRPSAISLIDLQTLTTTPSAAWGRIVLPPALSTAPADGSEKAVLLDSAWGLVEPLLLAFQHESNLSRQLFTALIRQRAEETASSQSTLLRTLLRYYYFGCTRLALLPLPPGSKPGQVTHVEYGSMDLANEFRVRHRALYDQYIAGDAPEPVTARQFRYYLDEYLKVSDELARNVRNHARNPGFTGNVRAAGPGEIYEIDATGGRLYLVCGDSPQVQVGKPTIYLLIDRWSRFVVSAYITLRPTSYEEVRHALLIAFTSREARFNRLGINVTDERWPVGRMPAVICPDRGSDFMSESMEQSVVNDLRIELTPLPPLCPDGKAIVERLIREIKRRMAASGIEGIYADRPMDPRTKKVARKAAAAAVRTLSDAYRLLVEIVVDHNNRPHSTLRRRRVLAQAGVRPTPREAYLWGLRHITGLRSAPLSEDDYQRLLLSTDNASIANGVLSYKSRPYLPDNEPAADLARHSTRRSKPVIVRLDKTQPTHLLVPNIHGTWARFQMSPGAAQEIAGISLDEEEAMAGHTALLWARADHEGRIARVASQTTKRASSGMTGAKGPAPLRSRNPTTSDTAVQLSRTELIAARNKETARMKADLHGQHQELAMEPNHQEASVTLDWMRLEDEERQRNLDLIRKHRNQR